MQYTIIYKCFHVFPGLHVTFKKSGTYAPPNFKRQLRNSLQSETTSSSTPFAKKGSMFFCVQWVWLDKMVQVLDLQDMLVVLSKYRFIFVNCYPCNQTNYWFPILASNIFDVFPIVVHGFTNQRLPKTPTNLCSFAALRPARRRQKKCHQREGLRRFTSNPLKKM